MTLQRAYDLLSERWPGQTFAIGFELWKHDHSDTGKPPVKTIEYAIWSDEEKRHYYGPTLETAMELALGCDADIAAAEDRIRGLVP